MRCCRSVLSVICVLSVLCMTEVNAVLQAGLSLGGGSEKAQGCHVLETSSRVATATATATATAGQQGRTAVSVAAQAFAAADLDGDGSVDRAEFSQWHMENQQSMQPAGTGRGQNAEEQRRTAKHENLAQMQSEILALQHRLEGRLKKKG